MNKYPVRISVKAVIIKDGKLLTIKHKRKDIFFTLPGGGQNHREDLKTALKRECLEETGARVKVGDVMFVRDHIADNHEFAAVDSGFHQVEVMFKCELPDDRESIDPVEMDSHQIGIEWLPLNNIEEYPLYPLKLREMIKQSIAGENLPIYLGDIN